MGFRLQQKSMTLNVNELLCRRCYAYCNETAESTITRFSLKVALYLSYLRVEFDDEIKVNTYECQA